ncbi:hypothetical protein BD410DRAFT_784690 [Rickenella mellea]|uniref:Autophagy-related protein 17 n=1 Tax=Rickenella mellea TaxID=50990 RepID=A0A4Y7QEG3_9AGAM|nr:hypothetical protein BD410DRAFT_784690 [Rickenella mellea]
MTSPTSPPLDSPHLVSLVLHSKKALQHGEQLCSRANDLSQSSSQNAVALLALDAKVRWIAQGIQEQLKLALQVAQSIEAQRRRLHEQAKQWDETRASHAANLDEVLESLGAQHVPPDFYRSSASSSLFGSQNSDDGEDERPVVNHVAPDRSKWKTLRDFVDERGIEDAVESMDNDRIALDDILAVTEYHPEGLRQRTSDIQACLPEVSPLPSMVDLFHAQEETSLSMARHLESLAAHYDQMAAALRDKESGVDFSEDDLQDMNRDTEELPAIIAELEEDMSLIESRHEQIESARRTSQGCLDKQREDLDQLDDLGDLISVMLEQQQDVETESQPHFAALEAHTATLETLHGTYTSYRSSYNGLLLEMERRRRYRDATELIVREMTKQLEGTREEELQAREEFYAAHGPHLPDDLCLCIANLPTMWDISPAAGEMQEALPYIPDDLIENAKKHVELDQAASGSASL